VILCSHVDILTNAARYIKSISLFLGFQVRSYHLPSTFTPQSFKSRSRHRNDDYFSWHCTVRKGQSPFSGQHHEIPDSLEKFWIWHTSAYVFTGIFATPLFSVSDKSRVLI